MGGTSPLPCQGGFSVVAGGDKPHYPRSYGKKRNGGGKRRRRIK